jgi:hypothetical protein
MAVYYRDRGPICYEASVFFNPAPRAGLPRELLSSKLDWCWESERRCHPGDVPDDTYDDPDLPRIRPLTPLTVANEAEFFRDLRERNADQYARFIALFGVDPSTTTTLLDAVGFRAALESYTKREDGPIRIVVIQLSDSNWEHVYLPHQPIPAMRELLGTWGLDLARAHPKLPYRRLSAARLENLYKLLSARPL